MLDGIRIFLAVAEAASLSAVARGRSVAVSSVSRKIDALERELGVKLLHRSTRLLMLTDAGEQFLPRARAIVAELDDAKDAFSELHAEPRGRLTVTAPSSFGRRHIAPAVLSFLKQYPLLEIDLHLSDEMVDLTARRVDVAIRIGVLPDSDLIATRLAPMRRLACASPAYLAAHGWPASPQQLLEHNCLNVATLPVPTGWWCFAGVNGDAALPVRGNLRCDDTETLLQAALAGAGVAHLASWMVSGPIAAGQLLPLFPDAPQNLSAPQSEIHAVRMPGRSHAAKAQLFIAHLRDAFGAPPYWERASRPAPADGAPPSGSRPA
ncbi:LysR family transcriptional regulator [Rugamonas sp. CCM 8940]|uniref:LysR family transcriptional regulator n=1 Tax=Rugamonas sp. CCM 8940 TaxID=2765359 RepID=UPI0018F2E138|nr:LysR family transcriptional regulator [Rugamonas sp. CCM 8940]MBJ7308748.1 LysR family transcriptional regulator [Rugamonas sp. CCM 8940]